MKDFLKKYRVIGVVLACVVVANVLVHLRVYRWDLTDDKLYSLSEASKALLRKTDAPIEVTLLLDGDLNAGFRRLKKATEETVAEMGVYGDVQCTMYDVQRISQDSLASMGLQPIVIHEREHNGKTVQTTVYPYVLMRYEGKSTVVSLLNNMRGRSGEENLNASIEQLEYGFMEALHRLQQTAPSRIAILGGHNEPNRYYTYDLEELLSQYFFVDRGSINGEGIDLHILDDYKAIIVANPQSGFGEAERFVIDQYIMRGGSVLWAVDGVRFSDEMLQSDGYTPITENELGIKEMFYHYGIQVYPALIQDIQCQTSLFNASSDPSQPNLQPVPWTYAPLLQTNPYHPISRNVGTVLSSFVSPIDAVNVEDSIDKIVLLYTSANTKLTVTPNEVNLNDINPDWDSFNRSHVPVAVSLEGRFPSTYAHRMIPEGVISDEPICKRGVPARQVVIGTGSVLMNEIQQRQPLPMGYDRYSGMLFGNRDFILNCVLWLTDSDGLLHLREKTVPLRLLNTKRAYDERSKVELISTICPVAMLLLLGGVIMIIRKRKYEK